MDPITEGEGAMPQDPEGGEGGEPQDPARQDPRPQEGGAGEGGEPQDPDPQEGAVNRHRYERDVQRRDKEIRDLRAQLKALNDSKAASGDAAVQLRKEMDDLKAQLADEKANAALSAAGCIDLDLGRTALAAYGGDASRLKEAKPYLFREDMTPRSTGGRPAGGTPDDARAKARRAAGLKD